MHPIYGNILYVQPYQSRPIVRTEYQREDSLHKMDS